MLKNERAILAPLTQPYFTQDQKYFESHREGLILHPEYEDLKCNYCQKQPKKCLSNASTHIWKTKKTIFVNEEKSVKNMGGHQGKFFKYEKLLFFGGGGNLKKTQHLLIYNT